MRPRRVAAIALASISALTLAGPASVGAKEPRLKAGVGRADITPPTGYPFGGWVRADRVGSGVHTRLYASALVLKSGGRKLALASVDLFAAPGGLIKEAADQAGHGFSERNVLVSASHTHAGPSQFANFATLNTVAPSTETITSPESFIDFLAAEPAEPQLYTFLTERIALALRRANRDLGPAVAAWGTKRLLGVTENRSLEAHLADHGVIREFGEGTVADDPEGYEHTIDPMVSTLRVDRLRGGRRVPLGGWSTFANHGTVNPSQFQVYNQDHHGGALRLFERRVRRRGQVPRRLAVVNVFGNSNEGDQSAGLRGQGPLIAERAGFAEGRAMFRAWRRAGRRLERRPPVGLRWTRVCFCGQQTAAGPVADGPLLGLPFLTGSEEGRGPLFDLTGIPFEGRRAPVEGFESQGHKIGVPFAISEDSYPTAVPLFVVRVGDRLIASLPGEATVEVGRRAVDALLEASRGTGVRGAAISGLANEFIQYLTTPEEYDRQHYEGGSTIFGPASSVLLTEQLAELAGRLARGEPAQPAHEFDPRNGVVADGAPFGDGAASAAALRQPDDVPPGAQAVFDWQGGPRGLDRPLDDRFVAIQRRRGHRWRRVADDLGLAIAWTVDAEGRYSMHWQVPKGAREGRHRVVVTANRYRLRSQPFAVDRSTPAKVVDPDHPASMFAPITGR
ncbi:MAG: neutral/alkaline non-lysosomal ceramidase N-terminal domain-containing protein [Solirubrobacterales bacterium]